MTVDIVKGGGCAVHHPHSLLLSGLILFSWWNVRQKVAVATLCALWVGGKRTVRTFRTLRSQVEHGMALVSSMFNGLLICYGRVGGKRTVCAPFGQVRTTKEATPCIYCNYLTWRTPRIEGVDLFLELGIYAQFAHCRGHNCIVPDDDFSLHICARHSLQMRVSAPAKYSHCPLAFDSNNILYSPSLAFLMLTRGLT